VSVAIRLGEEEVVRLAQILDLPQAPHLVEADSAAAVEAALVAAEHALLARGLLRETAAGGLAVVDVELAAVLETCARPVASIVLSVRTPGGEDDTLSSLHMAGEADAVVEHTLVAPGVHAFRTLHDGELVATLAAALGLDDAPAPDCPAGRLEHQRTLEVCMRLALQDEAAASDVLVQHGLEVVTARALARTMHSACSNGAFACLRHDTGRADGFATLAGDNGLWLLVADPADDADGVTLTPSSAAAVRQRLASLCALARAGG
jgi:hypothetical protein